VPGRYRIRVRGRADRGLVGWLGRLIAVLRGLPSGWRADVTIEREDEDEE